MKFDITKLPLNKPVQYTEHNDMGFYRSKNHIGVVSVKPFYALAGTNFKKMKGKLNPISNKKLYSIIYTEVATVNPF